MVHKANCTYPGHPRLIEPAEALATVQVSRLKWDGMLSKLAAIHDEATALLTDCKGARMRHGLDSIIRLSGGAK
jgi:hypothetical protein